MRFTHYRGFLENAFMDGIILLREDAKQKEEKALKEAKMILTDSLIQKSASNTIAQTSLIDINALLAYADTIDPVGRVAGNFRKDSEISIGFILKNGDEIFVPSAAVEVTVQGEVLNSSSYIFNSKYSLQDYIKNSGGYTKYADKRAVYVIRANGESLPANSNIFSGQIRIQPGDTIVVPRDIDQLDTIPLISVATKIISDIAFSAASLNAIRN